MTDVVRYLNEETIMNFGVIFKVLAALPQFLTIVSTVVHQVEVIMDQIPGVTSSQKLDAAKAQVDHIIDETVKDVNLVNDAKEVALPLIESSVAMFNAAKVFTNKSMNNVQSISNGAL